MIDVAVLAEAIEREDNILVRTDAEWEQLMMAAEMCGCRWRSGASCLEPNDKSTMLSRLPIAIKMHKSGMNYCYGDSLRFNLEFASICHVPISKPIDQSDLLALLGF